MANETGSAWDKLGTSIIDGAQQVITNAITNAANKKQPQPGAAVVQVQGGASIPQWVWGAGVGVVALFGFIILKRK